MKSSANFKVAAGVGLPAMLIAVCVILACEPFPGAQAQFGRGVGRFFRNFQRGATNVFRPMVRPIQAMTRPQQFIPSSQSSRPASRPRPQFSTRPRFPFIPQRENPTPARPSSGSPSSGNSSSGDLPSNSEGGIGGTKKPQSTGIDKPFPDDCGRDAKKGNGLLCFPDGKLCEERVNKPGIQSFGNHRYWFSWQDPSLANQKWDWFNARNYCRKRCMDLVSFETEAEYNWVKGFMNNVKYIWTSGRLCNFDGCDRRDFEPKNINGWFWSANQARLNPSNSRNQFHDWSQTGGFRPPRPQPDNREQVQQNGGEEACLAVLNNFYGDGIKWHDVACHHEKPIVCEDVEGHLAFARRTFPNIQIP